MSTTQCIQKRTLAPTASNAGKKVQFLADQFWNKSRNFYLHELQTRQKWLTKTECLKKGDVVVLKEKNMARVHWPLARLVEVKKSDDGLVRSVTVTVLKPQGTGQRKLERPITSVVLLHRS